VDADTVVDTGDSTDAQTRTDGHTQYLLALLWTQMAGELVAVGAIVLGRLDTRPQSLSAELLLDIAGFLGQAPSESVGPDRTKVLDRPR
jgi:hypothetical protein